MNNDIYDTNMMNLTEQLSIAVKESNKVSRDIKDEISKEIVSFITLKELVTEKRMIKKTIEILVSE